MVLPLQRIVGCILVVLCTLWVVAAVVLEEVGIVWPVAVVFGTLVHTCVGVVRSWGSGPALVVLGAHPTWVLFWGILPGSVPTDEWHN